MTCSLRQLKESPGFVLTAIVTFAIGEWNQRDLRADAPSFSVTLFRKTPQA